MRAYIFLAILIRRYAWNFFWFVILPAIIFLASLPIFIPIIYELEKQMNVQADEYNFQIRQYEFFAANENTINQRQPSVKGLATVNSTSIDYRAVVLDEFFRRNDSPLYGYGKVFVEKCNQYNAPYDCTTLPAIAWVETRLCGYSFSHEQRNCWGFGGSNENRIYFKDYEEAIDLITNRLVNAYGPYYMVNPSSMQKVYCGPHCESWGPGVQFMRYQISKLSEELGYPPLIRDDSVYKR